MRNVIVGADYRDVCRGKQLERNSFLCVIHEFCPCGNHVRTVVSLEVLAYYEGIHSVFHVYLNNRAVGVRGFLYAFNLQVERHRAVGLCYRDSFFVFRPYAERRVGVAVECHTSCPHAFNRCGRIDFRPVIHKLGRPVVIGYYKRSVGSGECVVLCHDGTCRKYGGKYG